MTVETRRNAKGRPVAHRAVTKVGGTKRHGSWRRLKEDAEADLEQLIRDARAGRDPARRRRRGLGRAVEEHLRDRQLRYEREGRWDRKRRKYERGRRRHLEWWVQYLPEGIEVRAVEGPEVSSGMTELAARGLMPATCNRYLASLRNFYKWASKRGWTDRPNPCQGQAEPEDNRRLRFLRPEVELPAVRAAFGALREERAQTEGVGVREVDRLEVLFELGVSTAVRRGHLIAIRHEDLDLARRQITIPRNKSPRARKREWVVRPSPRALDLLVQWLRADEQHRFRSDLVFPGAELTASFPRKPWYRVRELAGIGDMTWHEATCHTAISLGAMAGLTEAQMCAIYQRTPATIRRYTHLMRDHVDQAVDRVHEAFP